MMRFHDATLRDNFTNGNCHRCYDINDTAQEKKNSVLKYFLPFVLCMWYENVRERFAFESTEKNTHGTYSLALERSRVQEQKKNQVLEVRNSERKAHLPGNALINFFFFFIPLMYKMCDIWFIYCT